ncbi:DUF2474 domain-containing protein [Sphingobium sp. EP60837]|uniref:DUF2474 domain-containing protein n=1 Tax=Sphingobium sp. EP60837 TaxID=1855519 RepID=UPI003FA6A1F7
MHVGRDRDHHAGHPCLYWMGLLGLSWQSWHARLSLMKYTPFWKRLGWMALIWTGSVVALGAVSMILRFWLKT